jgi:predicted outer membrane repeat protein
MRPIIITSCFLALLIVNPASAIFRYVPTEFSTIQAAIDACADGDTVVIAPGRYYGTGNQNLNLRGKLIMVRSTNPSDPEIVKSTVIDCNGLARGFYLYTAQSPDSKIEGLTITNGYSSTFGGAIYCSNGASPTISNCVMTNNRATYGGAITVMNSNSRPRITNCTIIENRATVLGGAIYCNVASPRIENSIIAGNFANLGGAIYSHYAGDPVIINCTISGNAASGSGGGIYCHALSNLAIDNAILWNNSAPSASEALIGRTGDGTEVSISYCDVRSPAAMVILASGCTINWGEGNIDADPQFVDVGSLTANMTYIGGDYHLVNGSVCIDAGNPAFVASAGETDIDGQSRISGSRVDIGADEFEYKPAISATVEMMPKILNLASKGNALNCRISLPDGYNVADIDVSTITLEGQLKPTQSRIDDVEQTLTVRFERVEMWNNVTLAVGPLSLTVTGSLYDGTIFEGSDTIKVIQPGGKK